MDFELPPIAKWKIPFLATFWALRWVLIRLILISFFGAICFLPLALVHSYFRDGLTLFFGIFAFSLVGGKIFGRLLYWMAHPPRYTKEDVLMSIQEDEWLSLHALLDDMAIRKGIDCSDENEMKYRGPNVARLHVIRLENEGKLQMKVDRASLRARKPFQKKPPREQFYQFKLTQLGAALRARYLSELESKGAGS